MNILLDECVPRRFTQPDGHECQTVPEAGLFGRKNGKLLSLAEASGFEVFLTVDHGIPYQQNLAGREIAILLVRAKSNQVIDLLPLAGACLWFLESINPEKSSLSDDPM
jgi:hypothetical protein